MAKTDDKTTPKKVVEHPRYDVVRVERAEGNIVGSPLEIGDKLEVVGTSVQAKTAVDAADLAVNGLPEEERAGEFGGFLTRSWKGDEWETEKKTITRRKSQT